MLRSAIRNVFQKYYKTSQTLSARKLSSESSVSRSLKKFLFLTLGTVGVGTGYIWYLTRPSMSTRLPAEIPINVTPSKSIRFPSNQTGLKLTLYQYQTCPFCCKVRAFLDYHGLSYDVVEVNPVLRQQIKFSDWKKVPIVVAQDKAGVRQLNDSSMIISSLQTWLKDYSQSLDDIIPNYTAVSYENETGKEVCEIVNRYFIMYGDTPLDQTEHKSLANERKWRMWADDVLVHTISPNIYRTLDESFDAFQWFAEIGNWKENFTAFENYLVLYVGAIAMFFVAKKLKTRHGLKNDVRESLYDACRQWMSEVGRKPFRGGTKPDLSDLAVFGILSSMEGLQAFKDAKTATKIGDWYGRMQREIATNNTAAVTN